jgi:hypothetical protein
MGHLARKRDDQCTRNSGQNTWGEKTMRETLALTTQIEQNSTEKFQEAPNTSL